MRMRIASFVALTTLLSSSSACVTIGRFDAMNERVTSMELEQSRMQQTIEQEMKRMENLNTLLRDARETLEKNGASLVARIDELETRSSRNRGSIEELTFHVERSTQLVKQIVEFVERKYGTTLTVLPADVPDSPDALFKLAKGRLDGNKPKEARALFQLYLDRYPQGLQAADAQYMIGESFLVEKAYDAAIGAYQGVYTIFKSSPRMPEALMRIAQIFTDQKECDKAKAVYDLLQREAPKAPQASVAKERAKQLKDRCK